MAFFPPPPLSLAEVGTLLGLLRFFPDAVLATGEPHEEIEKHLDEMARQRWVDIDNHPDSGVVVYRFTDFA